METGRANRKNGNERKQEREDRNSGYRNMPKRRNIKCKKKKSVRENHGEKIHQKEIKERKKGERKTEGEGVRMAKEGKLTEKRKT